MLQRLHDAAGAVEEKRAAEVALERLKKVLRLGGWRGGEGRGRHRQPGKQRPVRIRGYECG